MKEGNEKKIFAIIAVVIIVLGVFVVITQYQFTEINKKDAEAPLIVKILIDKTEGVAPFEIKFSSIVTNNIGNVDYKWDFGDGETSEDINPIYIYENNGSYICNLSVTDESGKKSSDSINISSRQNQNPTVSIQAETDKPRRPRNILLEGVLPSITVHIEFFNSNDYRELDKKGWLDPFFKNMDSFYSVEAFAIDPDGDEIVSYNWTLRPPSYTTRLSKKPVDPVYYYSGRKIEIPAKDIYPALPYSLTLTITDSAGQQRSENFKFEVQKSNTRTSREATIIMISNFVNKWVGQYRTGVIGKTFLLVASIIFLKSLKNIPESLSLPGVKLLFMILLKYVLQTDPEKYTDESFVDVFKRIVYKDRSIFGNLTPEKWKIVLDKAEEAFKKLSKIKIFEKPLLDWVYKLQLIKEEIGLDNSRPEISNPYPENNQTFVDLNTTKVFITIKDKEGDPFSVHIFDENGNIDNSTGNYQMGQHNGTFNATLNPLNSLEEVTWKVLVIDQNGKEVTETYSFKTGYE